MVYIFDTSSLRELSHFYPNKFPSFWHDLNKLLKNDNILSVREVLNELVSQGIRQHLQKWVKSNKEIFLKPNEKETEFLVDIFRIPHFQSLINDQSRLRGNPVADPFVIASAKIRDGCVVTEEKFKANSAKIPNVCDHFKVKCTNVEGFMDKEGLKY